MNHYHYFASLKKFVLVFREAARDGIVTRQQIQDINVDAKSKNPNDRQHAENREKKMARGFHASANFDLPEMLDSTVTLIEVTAA
jgi:hypothetical protein